MKGFVFFFVFFFCGVGQASFDCFFFQQTQETSVDASQFSFSFLVFFVFLPCLQNNLIHRSVYCVIYVGWHCTGLTTLLIRLSSSRKLLSRPNLVCQVCHRVIL